MARKHGGAHPVFLLRSTCRAIDYTHIAHAPWLVCDPVLVIQLLQNPEPSVKAALAGLKYPKPTTFPLAAAAQQSALKYVFSVLADGLKIAAFTGADLRLDYSPYDSAPLSSEQARLAQVTSFGLDSFNLEPSAELATAQYLIRKQYQLLAATLYSLLRAERMGIPIGNHGSLADVDTQLETVSANSRAGLPSTVTVDALPAAMQPLNGQALCQKPVVSIGQRLISLATGQYGEVLQVTCAAGNSIAGQWDGSIPFSLQPILARHLRLLDLAGVSLSTREWRFSTQAVSSTQADLDSLLTYADRVVPLLVLAWHTADVSLEDIRDYSAQDVFSIAQGRLLKTHSYLSVPVPLSPDPPLTERPGDHRWQHTWEWYSAGSCARFAQSALPSSNEQFVGRQREAASPAVRKADQG